MANASYNGYLKYKQENGDIATLLPKTDVTNVTGAAKASDLTALTEKVTTIDSNVTQNTHDIADHGTRLDDLEANQTTADSNITKLTEDMTQAKKDITSNANGIAKEVQDRTSADTALDTRIKTLEAGAHNPPQCYISDTQPEAMKARDWWFDTATE